MKSGCWYEPVYRPALLQTLTGPSIQTLRRLNGGQTRWEDERDGTKGRDQAGVQWGELTTWRRPIRERGLESECKAKQKVVMGVMSESLFGPSQPWNGILGQFMVKIGSSIAEQKHWQCWKFSHSTVTPRTTNTKTEHTHKHTPVINTTSTALGLFKAASVTNKTDCTQCTTKSNKCTTYINTSVQCAAWGPSFTDTSCLRPDQVWVNEGLWRPPTLSQSVS